MSKASLIYNPIAGPAQRIDDVIAEVAGFWRDRDWSVTIHATEYAGHATTLAQQAASAGHGLVLAVGGDGTLGEVAAGLAHSPTILAPLPGGTANSFARELGLPGARGWHGRNMLSVARLLAAGRVQRMDLGHSADASGRGRYWMLWSGTGLDGFLAHAIEPRSKWVRRFGKAGYTLKALSVAWGYPGMRARLEVDGEVIEGDWLLATLANSRLFAGLLPLNPAGWLDDGAFELWLIRGRSVWLAFRYLALVLTGRHRHDPHVVTRRARQVRIVADPPMPFYADGDPLGRTPFTATIHPGALRLLVPPTAPTDLFQQPGEPL